MCLVALYVMWRRCTYVKMGERRRRRSIVQNFFSLLRRRVLLLLLIPAVILMCRIPPGVHRGGADHDLRVINNSVDTRYESGTDDYIEPLPPISRPHLYLEDTVGGDFGDKKVVAFAITLTKDGNHLDGAAVLATSIDRSCARSAFLCRLVAFLHDEVRPETEAVLRRLGYRTLRPGLPVSLDEIEDERTRDRVASGGCCGAAENMKLFAYTLTEYHRVVHLDTDVLVLQPFDPILDAEESLLHTTDINMANGRSPVPPVQGGFLVIRPDLAVFEQLTEVLRSTPFTGNGWGGSGIGLYWGGITVQGILPYFYERQAPPGITYRAVNRCEFNNMVDTEDCRRVDINTIRSVHFTNCEKPWTCNNYPHRKQPLCTKLLEKWFEARKQTEVDLGLVPSEACRSSRRDDYRPMLDSDSSQGAHVRRGS